MAKIGYIMTAPGYNEFEADKKWMVDFGCINNIRLVSIHDKIDSYNQLFPDVKTSDILTAIALLPKEANAIRKLGRHITSMRKQIANISQKAVGKAERNKRIINIYLQGFTIDEIFVESCFTSKSSIWRILNSANIELTRGHTKGPLGPRKKKEWDNTE